MDIVKNTVMEIIIKNLKEKAEEIGLTTLYRIFALFHALDSNKVPWYIKLEIHAVFTAIIASVSGAYAVNKFTDIDLSLADIFMLILAPVGALFLHIEVKLPRSVKEEARKTVEDFFYKQH